ncbi:MAG: VWA domain-containing protein, partial [gamma proteobacterium symbiont of Bathyaustriella thionipta]|nr:VWA domain-containing protein [gamma proteobacterium symbiont of Bathyaustriella thionipta]
AAARPQWVGEAVALPTSGRDMMLAIDLSGSMKEEDFQAAGRMINRLTAAKAVADDFIKRRVGDRIGLILFGSQPYLQAPLTPDRETLRTFLWEAQIGMAGQNTAIGDAIGMAIKQLKDHPANERVLILMTDGANTTGRLDPIKAADIAAEYGLKIYTIGMGADEILVRSLFGSRRVNPSRDLDEKTLKAVAEKTGGRYFRAHNFKELEQIYALLDELEPIKQDKLFYRPVKELFFWPAAIALLLLLLWPPLRAARGANT